MIPFVKAHACGNDFLVVQEKLAGPEPKAELTRRFCHRNQGIGADGVEFLTWQGGREGAIRLHNADGGIAEISGNGTRCVAAWMAYETKAGPGDEIILETDAGKRICRIHACTGPDFLIASYMGVPQVKPGSVSPRQRPVCRRSRGLHRQSSLRDLCRQPGLPGPRRPVGDHRSGNLHPPALPAPNKRGICPHPQP